MLFRSWAVSFLYDFIGCLLMAVAVKVFSAPNQIAPGGVTGIATMINHLTGLPIGTLGLVMNIPLLLIGYRKLGKTFCLRTTQTVLVYTIAVDALMSNPPIYTGDPMLAALFGGVISGTGAALVFMQGSTAGGTDIINKLIQKKYPHISTGQLVLSINAVVILSAALVYRNIEASLYGLVMTFTSGKVMDAILYGADTGKSCMIVTSKPEEMGKAIIGRIHRSATIMQGKGAYAGDTVFVLMCVVRKVEFYPLKTLIREIDPNSFIIVSEAHQIIGKGFKAIDAGDN